MKTQRLFLALASGLLLAAVLPAQTPLEQAAAALKAGDLAAAETLLAPLATGSTPEAAAVHQLGLVRLRQQRAADAVTLAEQAVKLAPDNPDYQAQLGQALAARMGEVGFMQQAVLSGKMRKAFEKAAELDPQHLGGLIGLTRFYLNAPEIAGGSPARARESATRVRALHPALGEAELGLIEEREENFAAALAHYETLSTLRANQPGPLVQCGRVLAKLGRKDEARGKFAAALQLDASHEGAKQALAALDQPGE